MDSRVAKRYARALFRAAQKSNEVMAVEADLVGIRDLLKSDPNFATFLFSPRIPREEKLQIVDKMFADRLTALSLRGLRLLLTKRREAEFGSVLDEFVLLRRQHGLVLYAKVTSSEDLDAGQKDAILAKLRDKSGKVVEADFLVDKSLLGGVKVQFGDFVLDGSISGSLNRLRETLNYDLLKQTN